MYIGRVRITLLAFLFIFCVVQLPSAARAQLDGELAAPAELKSWIPWVHGRHPEWNCARVPRMQASDGEKASDADRACVWLGASRFVISERRAEFTLQGELLRDNSIPLPSGRGVRPTNLRVLRDGAPFEGYVVSESDDEIEISLPKGGYSITGEFSYDVLPEQIPVPAEYGIVDIRLELPRASTDQPAASAYRDSDSIRISQQSPEEGSDSVEGRLWRSVSDLSPLQIKTKIDLHVSGKPRTINLGRVLPEHSILIASSTISPISFSDNGELSIQVFQGQHDIELDSVIAQPVTTIALADTSPEYLPDEEIWIWSGNPELRTVEIENVRTLNASQVELPSGWSAQSVFAVSRGTDVTFKELRRGQEIAQKNVLTLKRSIWPVVDGSALTVDDTLSGTMNSGFRLNALPDLSLGSASVAGVPIPVTLDVKTGAPGVELRTQSFSLTALSQIAIPRIFSATISGGGWDTVLENIQYTIAIPPSWKLVHINNVTTQFGTWTSFWSIFDLFILLIIGVFSFKIFGPRIGATFTVLVLLGKGEFMLPATFYGWTLFFAACSLLLSEKSYPMLRAACGVGLASSLSAFLLQGLVFAKLQLMQAIHPQLQAGTRYRTITQELFALISNSPFVWPLFLFGFIAFVLLMLWVARGKVLLQKFVRLIAAGIGLFFLSTTLAGIGAFLSGSGYSPSSIAYNEMGIAPQSALLNEEQSYQDLASPLQMEASVEKSGRGLALRRPRQKMQAAIPAPVSSRELQSGPSRPAWRWRAAIATVAGPVGADHSITLYFVPASIERVVCVVRLALTIILAFLLLGAIAKSFASTIKSLIPSPKSVAAILLLMVIGNSVVAPSVARAEFPDSQMLDELERRVGERQCKEDICASIDSLALELAGDSFSMRVRARSSGVSAVRVPGPVGDLIPLRITIDGKESASARLDDRFLQIKVPDGSHEIIVSGVIEPSGSLALTFPEKPLRLSMNLNGWKPAAPLDGAIPDEMRFVKESLGDTESALDHKKGVVPTRDVFRVIRQVIIDERANVTGSVIRLGDTSKAAVARIPLLPAENSNSSNWVVENGAIVVVFSAGQSSASFTSSIANPAEFTLRTAADANIFEEWNIRCKDYVQCESEGLPPTKRIVDGQNILLFIPFKGESITVRSRLLESAKGEHMTIDTIAHSNTWGETTLKGRAELALRATKQTTLTLSFADEALAIDTASVDGVPDSRKFAPSNVALLVEPGEHRVTVDYSKPFQPDMTEYVPALTLNFAAGNITTVVTPSPSRWIVWLGGSSWGPAVVFWSKLFVIIILLAALKIVARLSLSWFETAVLSVAISFLPTIFQMVPIIWVVFLSSAQARALVKRYVNQRWLQMVVSGVAVASVLLFYIVVRVGLLREPPSLITGNGSTSHMLRWFADFVAVRDGAHLPTPWVVSMPMTYWRTITLLLSVALVFLGLRWIRQTVSLLREEHGGEATQQ